MQSKTNDPNTIVPQSQSAKPESWQQPSEARRNRRQRIYIRVKAILDQFWVSEDTEEVVRALQLEGWIDVLEPCSEEDIKVAWIDYQREGPRTARGVLIKPDAGAFWQIIEKKRKTESLLAQAAKRREMDQSEQTPSGPQEPRVSRETFDAFARSMRIKSMGGKTE